ncbi:hypothetical protein [Actinokineospora sp.]|uniref:hypothetical protein n=1 Tax=Actinokineospora sp. TaxID=1872133 RepID=UPI003D6C5D31
MEPDGDRNKRMDWNLLLGGKHPHSERLGYNWLEFGRRLADGSTECRTLGCGLKAVSGRGIARHWFFVTSQRVGPEFSLVSPTRVALTRERLKDAVDGHGTVYDTATAPPTPTTSMTATPGHGGPCRSPSPGWPRPDQRGTRRRTPRRLGLGGRAPRRTVVHGAVSWGRSAHPWCA